MRAPAATLRPSPSDEGEGAAASPSGDQVRAPSDPDFAGVAAVLADYFDGLYGSDAALLREVFHPQAVYVCATGGALVRMTMDEYLPMVAARPSPASRGEARRDAIRSIEFAGPETALARVNCAIGPKYFTDLLSLVQVAGRWRIIAKLFHYDLVSGEA